MTIQIPSVVFFLMVLSLTVFDKKRLNSVVTPFTTTAWPFTIIILLDNFILIYFEFPPITLRVQFFIYLNVFLVWSVGFIISFFNRKFESDDNRVNYSDVFKVFARFDLFLIVLSMIVVVVSLYNAHSILQKFGGWEFLGDERYEKIIIIGPFAHLIQLGKVCFLILLFVYKHSKHKLLIILSLIGLFIAIASIQVKYHLLWLFIMGFLYINIDQKPSRQLRNIIFISLILVFIMNMFWFILTLAWGTFDIADKNIWEFFLKQFLNYFVSAPICLDKWLNWDNIKPDWTLLSVFLNIYYVITGNPSRINTVTNVSHGFLETAPGLYSNVGTSYGVYYLIGGFPFTIFMTICISFLSYVVYFQSRRRSSPILLYFNILLLTLAVLSFFVQYFTLVSLYEMTFFFILIIGSFKIINLVYRKNTAIPKIVN